MGQIERRTFSETVSRSVLNISWVQRNIVPKKESIRFFGMNFLSMSFAYHNCTVGARYSFMYCQT